MSWVDAKRKPNAATQVIAICGTHQIMAFYAPPMTVTDDGYSDIDLDYSEDDDQYYLPEGWYEIIRNWGEYAFVAVHEDPVTHWTRTPEPPPCKS